MTDKMPFQLGSDMTTNVQPAAEIGATTAPDWRVELPVLSNETVTLREVRPSDAPSLFAMLATGAVTRYMSPPPPDVASFERFIEWTRAERAAGRYLCYAVVPAGYDVAIGILQVRQLVPSFALAEWGAALGSQFWGTGLFQSAAKLLLDFVFDTLGVFRLEGRAAVRNGRANGAVRKLGAVPEGVLRQGLSCHGQHLDQLMWSMLADDWRALRINPRDRVH